MELDLSVIQTKQDLMGWFYHNFNFPDYFGSNWDAVDECLRDYCKGDVTIMVKSVEQITPEIKENFPILKSVIADFNEYGKVKITILE